MKKCILFVDDEANILQGLKRTLRPQRKEWDMEFAESGEEALKLIAEKGFDVVVTDMRMPGMDGAELLNEIKKNHPEIIRFVLSGYSEMELVMRSVGPSHQYLSKPCDPGLLKEKLAGAFALQKVLTSNALRSIVSDISSLPVLPDIYRAVVEELSSDDASLASVGKLVEQDMGMSTKILQLVNSAYFGLNREINSPQEAANFIGIEVLKSLVLAEGVFSQFPQELVDVLSLESLEKQACLVANAARAIARAENAGDRIIDQSFLGGLMHELGTLVLATNLTDDYLKAREQAKREDVGISVAERQIFKTTHAEVGACVLGLWGIDNDVVTAVAYHHNPWNYPDKAFSALTAVFGAAAFLSDPKAGDLEAIFTTEGMAYFERLGLSDRLAVWQGLCRDPEVEVA